MLIAIFVHAQWIFPLSYIPTLGPQAFLNVCRTVGAFLVAIGISLSTFAWFEFKNYFNFRWAFQFALFTLLTPWWGVLAELLIFSGLVLIETEPYGYLEPGPLAPIFNNLVLVSSLCFGILMLLWAIVLLYVRKNSRASKLTLGTSIIYLILAHMALLILGLFLPSLLFYPTFTLGYGIYAIIPASIIEIGVILNAVFFYRLANSLKPY